MKLAQIICESMTWDDLPSGASIHGHRLVHFDPHPATFSAQSLWLMMTSDPLPPPAGNPHEGSSWFEEASDLLSCRFSTRLISNFWPKRYDPRSRIDIQCADPDGKRVGMEPDNHQWDTLMTYLDGPMPHDWMIFWPTMGHCGYRVNAENHGVPKAIPETCSKWLEMVTKNIMPKIRPVTRTILFSDHGSARAGKSRDEAFRNGFAFVDERLGEVNDHIGWDGMRWLQKKALCSRSSES